jgi:hypothetical protein
MNLVTYPSHSRAPVRHAGARKPGIRKSIPGGHDLPVLAAGANLPRAPAWDELLEQGVQPCLVLGAERRMRGPR